METTIVSKAVSLEKKEVKKEKVQRVKLVQTLLNKIGALSEPKTFKTVDLTGKPSINFHILEEYAKLTGYLVEVIKFGSKVLKNGKLSDFWYNLEFRIIPKPDESKKGKAKRIKIA
jgi:hypothetical protein